MNCAVSIQRVISQHNREGHASEFMVRMGLNAGEAIQEEEDFFGAAVIVAARINALAEGGEILISEAVRQLAQGVRGVDCEFKGEYSLKGLREKYRIYKVLPTGQADILSLRRTLARSDLPAYVLPFHRSGGVCHLLDLRDACGRVLPGDHAPDPLDIATFLERVVLPAGDVPPPAR